MLTTTLTASSVQAFRSKIDGRRRWVVEGAWGNRTMAISSSVAGMTQESLLRRALQALVNGRLTNGARVVDFQAPWLRNHSN